MLALAPLNAFLEGVVILAFFGFNFGTVRDLLADDAHSMRLGTHLQLALARLKWSTKVHREVYICSRQ